MTDLIAAGAVLEMPADPATLIAAADSLAPAGRAAGHGVRDAEAVWRGLPSVYDAPETAAAVTAIGPISAAGADFEDTAIAASTALRTLGEELGLLSWTRTQLVEAVETHRAEVLAFRGSEAAELEDANDPLAGWGTYGFTRNVDLQERCAALQARLDAALSGCCSSIRSGRVSCATLHRSQAR